MKNEYRIEGDVAYVKLTQGKEARVDVADLPLIAPYRWFARRGGKNYYALSSYWCVARKKQFSSYMHRIINDTSKGDETDHIDGDGLNNRRSNLRTATRTQNVHNSRLKHTNSSGYTGVSPEGRRWRATISHKGKHLHLGRYNTPEEAAAVVKAKRKELWGEWTRD